MVIKHQTPLLRHFIILNLITLPMAISCTTPSENKPQQGEIQNEISKPKEMQEVPPNKDEQPPKPVTSEPYPTIDELIAKDEKIASEQKNKENKPEPQKESENEIAATIKTGIPPEMNEKVDLWIKAFQGKTGERFQHYMERGAIYKSMIERLLAEQGLPPELYYLALIESGFSNSATSRARAVGVWQFIRGTGLRYGLRVDKYVDERRDPIRSTIAASLYLRDLHNVFHSWYLAMAAYNAGEARIVRAIMNGTSRDFWTLVKRKKLPNETMEYIPKFLAALLIGNNPEKYGFKKLEPSNSPKVLPFTVPSPISLGTLAKETGIPQSVIKEFNPHILRNTTPYAVTSYRIWIPEKYESNIKGKETILAKFAIPVSKSARSRELVSNTTYHTVRENQTLESIASIYGISADTIKKINKLSSDKLETGSQLKISEGRDLARDEGGGQPGQYKVKKGDSLRTISKRFKISVHKLKKINNLGSSRIFAGQMLSLSSSDSG
ncbi:MAG: LysM peptidoglycan-binding domain-containing protein [Oligoflexales bacterium]|nr:LysM peptidoglycan-binding domain-containing protein [Oligoflexales bacterium]